MVGGPDVVIGLDRITGEDVTLRYDDRPRGLAIIGKSGTGKSSLLERLILADLEYGTPGIVIDPHGLLADRMISLARPVDAERIVVLDPSYVPFGLNLLACDDPTDDRQVTRAADGIIDTVKKVYGQDQDYIPRLEKYLDLAVRTLIPNRLTLAEVGRLLTDKQFREQCVAQVSPPTVQRALRDRWRQYDGLRDAEQLQHIESVANRLDRLLAPSFMQQMVRSQHTTVPFDEVLDGDTMLIISLSSEDATQSRADVIGALLLCALAERVFTRTASINTTSDRMHLYVDEYQRFATATTAQLLTQGRKYGIGVALAHQGRGQILDGNVSEAELHAGTLVVMAVTSLDADILAGEFPISPREEWIENIVEPATEPLKAISQDPIRELLSHTHINAEVRAAMHVTLRPLHERIARLQAVIPGPAPLQRDHRGFMKLTRYRTDDEIEKDQLPNYIRGLSLTNLLFVDAMESRLNLHDSSQFIARVVPILVDTKKYLGYGLEEPSVFMDWLTSFFVPHFLNALAAHSVTSTSSFDSVVDSLTHSSVEIVQGLRAAYPTEMDRLAIPDEHKHVLLGETRPEVIAFWQDRHEKQRAEHDPKAVEIGRFLHGLSLLVKNLAAVPIMVNSGQEVTTERWRSLLHPRQTYQDARNEFAAGLVNPSAPYTAHLRTPTGYHETNLTPPLNGQPNLQQVRAVRQRSQEWYGVPPPPTDDEPPENPDDDDDPPAISRRSPRR